MEAGNGNLRFNCGSGQALSHGFGIPNDYLLCDGSNTRSTFRFKACITPMRASMVGPPLLSATRIKASTARQFTPAGFLSDKFRAGLGRVTKKERSDSAKDDDGLDRFVVEIASCCAGKKIQNSIHSATCNARCTPRLVDQPSLGVSEAVHKRCRRMVTLVVRAMGPGDPERQRRASRRR
jgi:hypothetical protein